MTRLAQMRPIHDLLDRLTGIETDGGPRATERAMMADSLQRLFLGPQWDMRDRLELLAHLAEITDTAPLPARSRDIIRAEITRLTLRVLWSAGLMETGPAPGVSGSATVGRLLALAATDMLPAGEALDIVLKRARDLLGRHDVKAEIAADVTLRDRLLTQFVRANARLDRLEI